MRQFRKAYDLDKHSFSRTSDNPDRDDDNSSAGYDDEDYEDANQHPSPSPASTYDERRPTGRKLGPQTAKDMLSPRNHREEDTMEGDILARVSTSSLFFTGSWEAIYWVIQGYKGGAALTLYKNKNDFTLSRTRGDSKRASRVIPIEHNLRPLKIKSKSYPGRGNVYNFMLEEVKDFGPINIAKFGSHDYEGVELLWNQLRKEVKKIRKQLKAGPGSFNK